MFNVNKLFTMAVLLMLALFAGPAMATPASFDATAILADIALYLGGAVLIIGAFIAGRWSKKAMSLLNPS